MQKEQENKYFHEIDTEAITDAVVILDVDSTLVCSSQREISEAVRDMVRALQEKNTVYIFSNNFDKSRGPAIAKSLNVPYINAPHRKPNKKILNYIKEIDQEIVVIGDKYLTDELFARFSGGTFIRVQSYRCDSDHWTSHAATIFDDAVYALARLLRIVR